MSRLDSVPSSSAFLSVSVEMKVNANASPHVDDRSNLMKAVKSQFVGKGIINFRVRQITDQTSKHMAIYWVIRFDVLSREV